MQNDKIKRSEQAKEEQQPGNLSSFNNRNVERSTEAERAEGNEKGESKGNKDYNDKFEENSPARSS